MKLTSVVVTAIKYMNEEQKAGGGGGGVGP